MTCGLRTSSDQDFKRCPILEEVAFSPKLGKTSRMAFFIWLRLSPQPLEAVLIKSLVDSKANSVVS